MHPEIDHIPWPDGSSSLFREGEPSLDVAWIPESARDWHQYAWGYQTAYEELFMRWERHDMRPDSLIYPIIFLCRHYVELRLKELIQMSLSLLQISGDWKFGHKLDKLWLHVRPHIRTIWPDDNENELNHIETLIREFSSVDPSCMAFRYPTDLEGKLMLQKFQRLDVTYFKRTMNQLSTFLDAACQGTSVYLENMHSI